ncbi:hypothetical protein [Flavobacterium davisii]|uniref:Uncharacterized protein n=1 Tax=Flavobacterium columnare TaxID=996 RepID=A0A8G0PA44_9FLAO|nr:hypothetical protein [Flavobacterium davisii]QYS89088.1 hypothetical protein JJC05_01210 [Flavobacterium davisii]
MTKLELEAKIKELNEWLQNPENQKNSDYKKKVQARNYYVNRIIEIEEYGK